MKNVENYKTLGVTRKNDTFYHLMMEHDNMYNHGYVTASDTFDRSDEIIIVRSRDYDMGDMRVKQTGTIIVTVFHPGTRIPLNIIPCNFYEPLDKINQAEVD